MSWWFWLIISVYGFGVVVGSFITIGMAIDEDSDLAAHPHLDGGIQR